MILPKGPAVTKRPIRPMLLVLITLFIAACAHSVAPYAQETASHGVPAAAEIRAGLAAYQKGAPDQAAVHFENANRIQPENPQILLMLGSTYANQVIPTLMAPDNLHLAQQAVEALTHVLRLRPDDGFALRELASVYFNSEQWEQAKDTQRQILAVAPMDFEADYTIGAIDWTEAYRAASIRLKREKIVLGNTDYPTASPSLCREIASINAPLLRDASDHLKRAIALYPSYRDAMGYLALVTKLQAGTRCEDPAGRRAERAQAAKYASEAASLPMSASGPECPQPASGLVPLPPLPVTPPPPPPPPPARAGHLE